MFIIENPTDIAMLSQLSQDRKGTPTKLGSWLAYGIIARTIVDSTIDLGYTHTRSQWWTNDGTMDICVGEVILHWDNQKLVRYRANAKKFEYCIGFSQSRSTFAANRELPHMYAGLRFPDGTGFIIYEEQLRLRQNIRNDRDITHPITKSIKHCIDHFDEANSYMDYLRNTKISHQDGCQMIIDVLTQPLMRTYAIRPAIAMWNETPETKRNLESIYRTCLTVQHRYIPWRQVHVLRKLREMCNGYSGGGLEQAIK